MTVNSPFRIGSKAGHFRTINLKASISPAQIMHFPIVRNITYARFLINYNRRELTSISRSNKNEVKVLPLSADELNLKDSEH